MVLYALFDPKKPEQPFNIRSIRNTKDEVWIYLLGREYPPSVLHNLATIPRDKVIKKAEEDGYRVVTLSIKVTRKG